MRTLDLDSLEIFRTVAAEGGIVRAAARLNRVQSNVTTRVRQLEDRLGVKLFRRLGRGIALTAEGEALLPYAERLLRLADDAASALRAGQPTGLFRLGSIESAAGIRLPPVLAALHRRHPAVTIDLSSAPTAALLERLRHYEMDAAFVSEPFDRRGVEVRLAFREELVMVAPAGLSREAALRRAAESVIAFSEGCSYRRRLLEWLEREGLSPARSLSASSYHAIAACVAAGAGVAILPLAVLRSLPAQQALSAFELPEDLRESGTYLVWQAPAFPALEALLAALEEAGKGDLGEGGEAAL